MKDIERGDQGLFLGHVIWEMESDYFNLPLEFGKRFMGVTPRILYIDHPLHLEMKLRSTTRIWDPI